VAAPKRFWHDLTSPEFRALDPVRTVAVLPIGATEQHGPHLAVSVDTTINEGVIARALALIPDDLPVLVLPTQAIGVSVEHARFPGSLSLSPETAIAAWTEIGEAVAAAGVRKLLLFNSHGGQPQVAEIVCRRLRLRHGIFAATCLWSRLAPPTGLVAAEELRFGIHAGQVETALMRALAPDRVRMECARDFANSTAAWDGHALLRAGGAVAFGWQAGDLNPAGAVGAAAAATAELGEAVLDRAGRALAALLAELSALDAAAWLADAADA
jgi:creatinine amidohydrolase